MAMSTKAPAPESAAPDRLDTREFAKNMLTVGMKSQKLLVDFTARMASRENPVPLDPLNISGAMLSLAKAMSGDREAVVEAQTQWWNNFMTLWESTARKMLGGEALAVVEPAPGDRRFKAEAWKENVIFDFIKQSYLLTANAMQEMVGNLHGLDEKERGRVAFYTRQFADALAPTNFPLTNPDVLKATIASNGENLVKGLDNLLADIERGHGELSIRQTSGEFTIGENVATTPGKVVFRNQIMELLQYSPATDEVYARPLLIFPPWINKFYIIDLRPENSFVRWLVGQGYTVFLVSWVNPGADMAGKGFEDYMQGGIFAALDAVEKATGVKDPNCVGYCIGGTLLAATLAYMAAQKSDDRIHSATFWAAQTDFSEAGELSVFVDEAQLEALKAKMDSEGGVLPGSKMAGAFNMLRANDLIWSFVINNYLLGKQPMPFDLLYWNSDTTRMPEKLHLSYLRQCYKENALASGKMKMAGVKLDLSKITVPVYLQSAREDHIAPANSVFKSVNLFKGPVRFIIAGSGHIAGVINPPAAKRVSVLDQRLLLATKGGAKTIDAWKKGSSEHPGSWWPDWDKWLSALSGEKVPARQPGDGELKVLGDAPGTYVKVKAQ